MWAASDAHATARGLGKRRAARALSAVSQEHLTIEANGRARWSTLPETVAGVESWAASVGQREAGTDPLVEVALERAGAALQAKHQLAARQMQERANLRRQVFGDRKPSDPRAQAARWQKRAEIGRRDLAAIEALPVVEAAELIRERTEAQQAAERALTERAARLHESHRWSVSPRRGAERGGLSL